MFGQRTAIYNLGGRNGNAVPIDIGIEPIRGGTTSGAKEMIEPPVNRPAVDGTGIVDQAHCIQPVPVDRLAFLVKGGQPDVPLPEHRRLVPLLAEHARQGQPLRSDQTGSPHPGEDSLVIETESHTPGQHAVTGRSTNRGRTVGIGKKHSFLGQLVEVGGGNPGLRVVATDVPVSQIIRQNENYVRI